MKGNIKIDLQELGRGATEQTNLAQDRDGWWVLANAVMDLLVR
jgi:hypothetical protein